MLRAALRDLQWRRKRFVITIIGTGARVRHEPAHERAQQLVRRSRSTARSTRQAADWWVTRDDAAGAFSPGSFLTPDRRGRRSSIRPPGSADAAPVLYGIAHAPRPTPASDGNEMRQRHRVRRASPGQLGAPTDVAEGTTELAAGEVVGASIAGRARRRHDCASRAHHMAVSRRGRQGLATRPAHPRSR